LESLDPHAQAGAAPTVLVCDDEDSLRELIRAVLGDRYHFVEAVDGDEALARLAELKPAAIVLDLMLPRTSGFDVLARVRNDAELAGIPVIIVSAWSHLEREALAAGADRFVSKPFDPDDLATAVEDLLARA
jgi:CheY-like chemotaxis protein